MIAEQDLSRLPEYQVETLEKLCHLFSNIQSEKQRNLILKGLKTMLGFSEDELEQVVDIVQGCNTLTETQLATVFQTLFGPLPGS